MSKYTAIHLPSKFIKSLKDYVEVLGYTNVTDLIRDAIRHRLISLYGIEQLTEKMAEKYKQHQKK
jgi:Arc/MetJ-type ribon-helix-helix transcriptional regulator